MMTETWINNLPDRGDIKEYCSSVHVDSTMHTFMTISDVTIQHVGGTDGWWGEYVMIGKSDDMSNAGIYRLDSDYDTFWVDGNGDVEDGAYTTCMWGSRCAMEEVKSPNYWPHN